MRKGSLAECQWHSETDKADCLRALELTARHAALLGQGYALQPIEAELSLSGRLTVRVAWTREKPRDPKRAGNGLLARAWRRERIGQTVSLDLPPAEALRAAERLRRRAKLESSL